MAVVQRRGSAGFRPLTLFIAVDSKKLYSKLPADPFGRLCVYCCWCMWMTKITVCVTCQTLVYSGFGLSTFFVVFFGFVFFFGGGALVDAVKYFKY